MKIVDKTPYRSETGEISLIGRVQGMLKYGMSWPSRLKAQDVVIAIIEKQLDSNYALLRNITLPYTEINLPFVLIGPPGIYLINVTHERGVFIARDDKWGTMIGDRFVGARINQIGRTQAFGRVLQVYLDRQGFKGSVVVESILMAADPGMQIESTRPAVRVVMSDALERFAVSMNQARSVLNAPLANDLVRALLVGRPPKPPEPAAPEPATDLATTSTKEEDENSSLGAFSFDEKQGDSQTGEAEGQKAADSELTPPPAVKKPKKKKKLLGLTTAQLVTVVIVLLVALCAIAVAAYFVFTYAG
jgi:hypothetical protein